MVTLHQVSIPVFIKHLNGLAGRMRKAQSVYAEKKYDEAALLGYRFYPDMFNFAGQVPVATDHTRNYAALLGELTPPKFKNNEKSLAGLIDRTAYDIMRHNGVEAGKRDFMGS